MKNKMKIETRHSIEFSVAIVCLLFCSFVLIFQIYSCCNMENNLKSTLRNNPELANELKTLLK